MRCLKPACLALLLLTATLAPAQEEIEGVKVKQKLREEVKFKIKRIRVGFLGGVESADHKPGAWTPVYVDLAVGTEPVRGATLVVETVDSDDVRNRYAMPLPALEPRDEPTVVTYTKPGSASGEISVAVYLAGQSRPISQIEDHVAAIDLDHALYLTIGSRLAGLRRAVKPNLPPGREDEEPLGQKEDARHVATVDDLRLMPTRWFAYEPVDLMILTTGDRAFLTSLVNEREGKKEALAEWVRRGGRLIVSVGQNQDMVAQVDVLAAMLPVKLTGTKPVPEIAAVADYSNRHNQPFRNAVPRNTPNAPPPPIEMARLEPKPDREIEVRSKEADGTPVIVRGVYGLGQVTVIAFDVDRPPMTTYGGQRSFWLDGILKQFAPPVNEQAVEQRRNMGGFRQTQEDTDLATRLQMNLEMFQDVPVISFGWVALFILIYILIVGPLDYFFLKKVVKRLELTWITFPTVVITISVAAYFTAYWLKGNDQKINKIDLVDIDLHTQQLYGNTWFTIFSPRIQNYTVGVEPFDPGWAPSGAKQTVPPLVSWMGRPEATWGGVGRARSQGLFRRAYDYAPDATGLRGVPIQVWSTKSFASSWQAPLDPARPLVSATFRRPPDQPIKLSGTVTSRLPVPLEDVSLYVASEAGGRWYNIGRLLPDTPQRIDTLVAENGIDWSTWINAVPESSRRVNPVTSYNGQPRAETISILKELGFHNFADQKHRDTALRGLDQSWRSTHRQEAILFGRVARADGPAEDVESGGASPTRLWLGSLPGGTEARQPLVGGISQETYVRVFVPVRTGDSK